MYKSQLLKSSKLILLTKSGSVFLATVNVCLHCPLVKMEDDAPGGSDNIVTEFATYEEFLDSQITSLDLYYLEVLFTPVLTSCTHSLWLNAVTNVIETFWRLQYESKSSD